MKNLFYLFIFGLFLSACSSEKDKNIVEGLMLKEIPSEVRIKQITGITPFSASIQGLLIQKGALGKEEFGYCYSTTPNPTVEKQKATLTTYGAIRNAETTLDATMSALQPNTTYYVRGYSILRGKDISYSAEQSFKTLPPLIMTTLSFTHLEAISALAIGQITNFVQGNPPKVFGFVYSSTNTVPTLNDQVQNMEAWGVQNERIYVAYLKNLQPNTTYYFRAYGTDAYGTAYGEVKSFKTLAVLIQVWTGSASNVTHNSAMVNGALQRLQGTTIVKYGHCYGTSLNPDLNGLHTTNLGSLSQPTDIVSTLTNLNIGTMYYYRTYVVGADGTVAYGENQTFTTQNVRFAVTTGNISNITTRGATLEGNVTELVNTTLREHGFLWSSTNPNPDLRDTQITMGTGIRNTLGSFSRSVEGFLNPGTRYYVRAYAISSVTNTAVFGEVKTFTTNAGSAPTLRENMSNHNVTNSSMELNAEIINTGTSPVTEFGIVLSENIDRGLDVNTFEKKFRFSNFSGLQWASFTGLKANTKYYARAYAINQDGIGYTNIYYGQTSVATRIISLNGNFLNFGELLVGQSLYRTFTIGNTGNSPLTVSNLTLPNGFSGNFSGTIAAGASQTVIITFNPQFAGTFSGVITVNANHTAGDNTVNLSGIGVQKTRVITITGDSNFGSTNVGQSTTRTFTIHNSGSVPLTINNLLLPNGFSGNFSGTIAAGASQSVTITFNPNSTGTFAGTLIVNANHTSGNNTINLSGIGTQQNQATQLTWISTLSLPVSSLSRENLYFTLNNVGYMAMANSSQFWRFVSNTGWQKMQDVPFNSRGAGAFVVGSYAYVCADTDLWRYNPSLDQWQKMAGTLPFNFRGWGFAIGVEGVRLGFVGGISAEGFWSYNPNNNTWTKLANHPKLSITNNLGNNNIQTVYSTACNIGSKFYFSSTNPTAFWEYDASSQTWTSKSSAGNLSTYSTIMAINGKCYMYSVNGKIGEFDPNKNTWTNLNDSPISICHPISFSINGEGFVGMGAIHTNNNCTLDYNTRMFRFKP